MAGLTPDVGEFLTRLTRLDAAALVRLQRTPGGASMWARVPWDVLVTRTVGGLDLPLILGDDITVSAREWLAAGDADLTALARHDNAWRAGLPTSAGVVVETMPTRVVRRVSTAAAETWPETLAINLEKVAASQTLGFPAYKIEPLADCVQTNAEILDMADRVGTMVDGAMEMLVDVGHRWQSAKEALRCLQELERWRPGFIETPMWLDDVAGYRRLADHSPVPIAIGELFVTANEFSEMMDHGGVDIVQPGVARVGFTQAMRIAEAASARSRQVVPYGWVATTIGVVANNHFVAALDNCPWTEYCHPELFPRAELRHNLAGPEPVIVDGQFALPPGPGLGVEVDETALKHYRVE